MQCVEFLDSQRIIELLDTPVAAQIRNLSVHKSLDSTNTWLMQQADTGAPAGLVCLAEQQTAGRGRHGCSWISPPGGNLYLSLLWRYPLPPKALGGLSLACGVATARALWRIGITGLSLKWPNDVLWGRSKLAGLLLEVRGDVAGPSYVIVGLGLNVKLDVQSAAVIDQPWIDLARIVGSIPWSRNKLAALVISELVTILTTFGTTGLAPFIADWTRHDALQGAQVRLIVGDREHEGEYIGIASDGALRLRVNGVETAYYGGEVKRCRFE